MNKVGIKRIGIADKAAVNDVQTQSRQNVSVRGIQNYVSWISAIDQRDSSFSSKLESDENGMKYLNSLRFVVRKAEDISRLKLYARRPVVIYVDTVDGNSITIGSSVYPAYMTIDDDYDNLSTRQLSVEVEYESLTSLI